MSRYASRFNKRDANEPDILKALARIGVEWIESGPLDGWLVLKNQPIITEIFIPTEIKMPGASFTESQEEFINTCQAYNRPHFVWRSVKDAVDSVQAWRQRA